MQPWWEPGVGTGTEKSQGPEEQRKQLPAGFPVTRGPAAFPALHFGEIQPHSFSEFPYPCTEPAEWISAPCREQSLIKAGTQLGSS